MEPGNSKGEKEPVKYRLKIRHSPEGHAHDPLPSSTAKSTRNSAELIGHH